MRSCCVNCRYFLALDRERPSGHVDAEAPSEAYVGECHRCPPVPGDAIDGDDGTVDVALGAWPAVFAGSWCGEFSPTTADVGPCGDRSARVGPRGRDRERGHTG